MVKNLDKKISNIQYNHLNLPTEITFDGLGSIEYLYDALGTKLQKTVVDNNSGTSSTKYRNGFQYTDGALDFFPTAEGYVKVLNAHVVQKYQYVYNFTDHLGNIRLRYTLHPQTQEISILEEDHYYPYGLKHSGYDPNHEIIEIGQSGNEITIIPVTPFLGDSYKYKFGGMEYSDEFDINTYDFGMRNYDPALGRWMNIDPLAELMRRHSPYNYAFNNPIFWIDPDGMNPQIPMVSDGYVSQAANTISGSVEFSGTFDAASSGESNSAESGMSNNSAAYSSVFQQAGETMANADLSLDGGCPDGDCGESNNINWKQAVDGGAAILGGTILTVGGIATAITGIGAPAGAGAIILGVPTIGFGTANLIEAFRGGNTSLPNGPLEAVDIGFGGDGTVGQIGDVFSGGLPKNITSGVIMGYGLYNSNVGQSIINNSDRNGISPTSNYPREIQQDNTRTRKPLISN